MQYEEIKKLMEEMGKSNLSEMEIEFKEGMKISMKKDFPQYSTSQIVEKKIEEKIVVEENNFVVTSPMVGTFYSKASPTAKPFVEVGSKVKKGDSLCIIEAMKLMNEIEAEQDGEIVEILVKDEEMVDYGKPLFKVK